MFNFQLVTSYQLRIVLSLIKYCEQLSIED